MVKHTDWAAHLEAVDDMVLRSGTLKAAAAQIRRLQAERDELLDALKYCRAVFPQDRWADDTKKMIDAAIAKATGEHQ